MFSVVVRQQLAPIGIQVFEAIAPAIFDTELNVEGRKNPVLSTYLQQLLLLPDMRLWFSGG